MAREKIKPLGYNEEAIPTLQGWEDPNTGELLESKNFTQQQIDEYFGNIQEKEEYKVLHTHDNGVSHSHEGGDIAHTHDDDGLPSDVEPSRDDLQEINVEDHIENDAEEDLESMSKKELEEMGREHGIELDRRKKKSTLIERLKSVLSK